MNHSETFGLIFFFRGLSSCHRTLKDRKQIVGSIERGMRDWRERGWISSGSLACAIADEHSWNVFEELGWHPAKRMRERGTSRKQSERGRESEAESGAERSTSRLRDWALVKQTDRIQISILWHFALIPDLSPRLTCTAALRHTTRSGPKADTMIKSSWFYVKFKYNEKVSLYSAFYYFFDFSSFSLRSGV